MSAASALLPMLFDLALTNNPGTEILYRGTEPKLTEQLRNFGLILHAAFQRVNSWTLTDGGKTLVIERKIEAPQGEFEFK